MPKKSGYESAVRAAVEKLGKVDLTDRCTRLGLSKPQDGILKLRAFGTDMVLRLPDFELFLAANHDSDVESHREINENKQKLLQGVQGGGFLEKSPPGRRGQSIFPAKISDRILVLHYLLCDLPIQHTNELISFRQMDSGQFYWPAFLSRSVRPLVERIGNDLELLKKNLSRFDWEPVSLGDFGARIHAIGKVYVTLIYHLGDEEFPSSADLLFDSSIKRVYPTEDAAVLASRICLGLL